MLDRSFGGVTSALLDDQKTLHYRLSPRAHHAERARRARHDFLFCSCCVAGSVSLSRPQVSSPLASGRHRERSPARDRVSYDDRRIAFSYACVGAVAVQDARARDRRPNSSLCRRVSHHYTSPCRRERHPTRDRMSYITMCRASRCCMCPRASGQDARAEDRRTHGPRSTKEVR